jgi:hypothetical protein
MRLNILILPAPWVDPAHSHMTAWQLAQHIPTGAFSIWNQIPRFFMTNPVIASSGAVMSSVKDAFSTGSDSNDETERKRLHIEREYGMPRDLQVELEKQAAHRLFKEDTVGANVEVLQCLRKRAPWGECDDYTQFVIDLAERERRASEGVKLTVRAFFAESDIMIGKRGQAYFESCFKGFGDVLQFESKTVLGENHDSMCFSPEVLAGIFQDGMNYSVEG